jgi:PAT family beta-lactamase induction signal transducer AmpG
MASIDPTRDIVAMALFALLVAFSSATQDVAIDAYRIEAVPGELQGAMAGMYQTGWRIAAALVGGAGALYLAEYLSWTASYFVMAASMLVGVITVLIISEPERAINRNTVMSEQRVVDYLEGAAHVPSALRIPIAWFIGAVICPFTEFFQRNGSWALLILLFIGIYRISDIVLANMAYPFYIDLGFSKTEIANVAKLYGVILTIIGAVAGGMLVTRFGVMRILLLAAILVVCTNLLFAQLATIGKSLEGLIWVISADNFSGGLAGSAFIAYLSRLTNTAYTATQYALFSSLMTLMPKFISGFSGLIVDGYGYVNFFIYASATGIPTILLVLYLMRRVNVCDSCRKASGAALTVFVGFEDERIELLKGEPRIYKSSAGVERAFCQACGTSLWYRDARLPKTTYFLLGILDEPEQFKPEHHAWESKRLRWLEIDDEAQRHLENSVPRRPTW